jgi:RNA polymerase sigma-70 factor, ECF subfamily
MTSAMTDKSTPEFEDEINDPAKATGSTKPIEEGNPAELPFETVDWISLVDKIRGGDAAAMDNLYRLFYRGVRFYLCRQLGIQDLDDKIHDTFVIVVQAIRRGELREPERLMGYVRTVVRRQVAAHIDEAVHNRREMIDIEDGTRLADARNNPEQIAIVDEQAELMAQVLRTISRRDREILTRFYLQEQSQEEICQDMGLTETQFRLLKSRAKQRFGELGRQKLIIDKKTQPEKLLRKSQSAGH